MISKRLLSVFLLVGVFVGARPGWSQVVGKVSSVENEAWIVVENQERQIENDDDIVLSIEMKTGRKGRVDAVLNPVTRFGGFALLPKTLVHVLGKEGHFEIIKIGDGTLLRQGPGEVQTPTVDHIIGKKTAFIVRFDAETKVTEVIAINGEIDVIPTSGGKVYPVELKHKLSVSPGGIRSTELSAAEFDEAVRQFEFIGRGRAESQVVASRLTEGEGLKAKECAPVVVDEWPKRPDPPFTQPSGVVKAPRLGIEF